MNEREYPAETASPTTKELCAEIRALMGAKLGAKIARQTLRECGWNTALFTERLSQIVAGYRKDEGLKLAAYFSGVE